MVNFNKLDNEPPIEPRRNRTKGPLSSEMIFKPCIKMVNYESDRKSKNESLRIIVQDHEMKKPRPEKLHYFKYKEEYIADVKKKEVELDHNEKIKEEMRLMNKIGFTDKRILPNASLLNMASKKEKKSIEETSAYWKKKEMDRINAIRDENEQISRDRDYVKTLNNWDGKFLPKINK
jgi:hypothetical protein